MPALNQEKFIADSLDSVIRQTFRDWELIIVDDGSTDKTASIVRNYTDDRIRYFYHPNQGVSETRNAGINHARGEYIAFLDADDLFHPEKLKAQVDLLDSNPETGLVYVSRFEIDKDGIELNLVLQPATATLSNIVLEFPFAPSDLMIRRYWLEKAGGFDRSFVINEDREWYVRMILAGCRCQGIEQFLSYRRLNDNKVFKDLPTRMDDMQRALQAAFLDPRCPEQVLALQPQAYHNIYRIWTYQAALQGESDLTREFYRQAVIYGPSLNNDLKGWIRFLIHTSIRDGGDHEKRLRILFSQLPFESTHVSKYLDKAISRGYLIRGTRETVWGRDVTADLYFGHAKQVDTHLDQELINILVDMLMKYEKAFGVVATKAMTVGLFSRFRQIFGDKYFRKFLGFYSINQAFKAFNRRNFSLVIEKVTFALIQNPAFIFNRGVISILCRSAIHRVKSLFHINQRYPA